MSELLKIESVSKIYRMGGVLGGSKLKALDDVSLGLDGGKPTVVSIVGESGSGKTTLARIILKITEPSGGRVLLEGRDIFHRQEAGESVAFRRTVQPIFQNPFDTFSQLKPVDSYLYATALNLGMAANKKEATDIIADVLHSVGLRLDVVVGKYPRQFSGGELQRVSIARALITKPKIIVADEPVSMIDASLKMNIVNLFKELKETYKVSFIYITHDLSTAYYISDYVAIMYRGSVVEYGPSSMILTEPLHPYTELLIDSVPKVGHKWEDQIKIPDEARPLTVEACKFTARCPYVQAVCKAHQPPRVRKPIDRQVLCFKYTNFQIATE